MRGANMRWYLSDRADPRAVQIADRHYNRQKIGSPQCAPPGRCLVLLTEKADALWITSWPLAEFVKHAWAGAWVCSCFRNQSTVLSSDLIREAVAITRWFYGDPPELGFITFVNPGKLKKHPQKREPGFCYEMAGWTRLRETTKGGLVALQLLPEAMPVPCVPLGWKAKSVELDRHVEQAALIA